MICSAEKRLRFMSWSSCGARTNFKPDQDRGQRHPELIHGAIFNFLEAMNQPAVPSV